MEISPFRLYPIEDFEKVLGRAGEAVELRDDEGVTFSNKIYRRLKLRPASDRRDLLAENFFAAGSLEVSHLGVEAGLLI